MLSVVFIMSTAMDWGAEQQLVLPILHIGAGIEPLKQNLGSRPLRPIETVCETHDQASLGQPGNLYQERAARSARRLGQFGHGEDRRARLSPLPCQYSRQIKAFDGKPPERPHTGAARPSRRGRKPGTRRWRSLLSKAPTSPALTGIRRTTPIGVVTQIAQKAPRAHSVDKGRRSMLPISLRK